MLIIDLVVHSLSSIEQMANKDLMFLQPLRLILLEPG